MFYDLLEVIKQVGGEVQIKNQFSALSTFIFPDSKSLPYGKLLLIFLMSLAEKKQCAWNYLFRICILWRLDINLG
jgi:hypothetical protein